MSLQGFSGADQNLPDRRSVQNEMRRQRKDAFRDFVSKNDIRDGDVIRLVFDKFTIEGPCRLRYATGKSLAGVLINGVPYALPNIHGAELVRRKINPI